MPTSDRSPLGYAVKTLYFGNGGFGIPAKPLLVSPEEKKELSAKFKSFFPNLATILSGN
jgi:hypothetical protein